MKRRYLALGILTLAMVLTGCGSNTESDVTIIGGADGPTSVFLAAKIDEDDTEEAKEIAMTLSIDGKEMPVTWEDNASVNELKEICPLKVDMSMYGGFEQVGSIGQSISRDDKQITTWFGDIVLYSGNQIVVFYGSNSWAYTKLGHIDLPEEELTELLGNGDVVLEIK